MGGTLEDPNVSRNKAISGADIIIEKAIDQIDNRDWESGRISYCFSLLLYAI